jgi:hypothetical protein
MCVLESLDPSTNRSTQQATLRYCICVAIAYIFSTVILRAAIMYSPWQKYLVRRDPSNDGIEGILTLDDFLSFAKNNSGIGVYVQLQVNFLNKFPQSCVIPK